MNTATEMKALLQKFSRGIRNVTQPYPDMIVVSVRSAKAAASVQMDLMLSGGFRTVTVTPDNINGGFSVNAVTH